ncbi:hypothetical protein BDB01DRAFT_773675 [Pilobolus umbonatus]|nr:hypothetical protein BDB01DRAFT_773675 [Pilobolus umbonatus]
MPFTQLYNKNLLNQPWILCTVPNKNYYMKCLFEKDYYVLIISDLKSVWYTTCSADTITQQVKQYNIELETDDQISRMIQYIKDALGTLSNSVIKCHKENLEIDTKMELGYMTFHWKFLCQLMNKEDDYVSSAEFIFQHLIVSTQILLNHYTTENAGTENKEYTDWREH